MNLETLKAGTILNHSLGFPVSVIKVMPKDGGKGKKDFHMIKCRYQDNNGMLHIHEFFVDELWLNGIRIRYHADII
jgi:hypothetical protein